MKKLLLALLFALSVSQIGRTQIVYTLSACGYAPIAGGGTALPLGDDVMSGMIPLGFTFNFYGSPFTTCDVSSNGFLTFNAGMGSGCCSGQVMPAAGWPTMIAWSWDDMYTIGGTVNYFTSGVAPNRIFVLNYNNVGYCCTSANNASCQIQLYETSNQIRILSANNNHAGRTATMGIQMIGQGNTVVPGRNSASWTSAANECQLFTPGVPPPPVNDNPCGAIALTVSAGCTFVGTTNISATATAGPPAPGCAGYSGGDVWYTAVVPASGSITFDTQQGVVLDGGMAVYSAAACGGPFTLITCNDNGSSSPNMPFISLTGQPPGSTLWIRFWENGNNNNGSFSICAYDPPPPLCYSGTNIAFAPDPYVGTAVVLGDDQYSGVVNIGFNFCVDGASYTQLLISSNNYVDFDLGGAGGYSPFSIPGPIPLTIPAEVMRTVMSPWEDLYPPAGGTINYQTLGIAPNRRFVVSWFQVPMFSCTGQIYTSQLKLFEGSNCIEMHLANKPTCPGWNGGQAIQGINNWNGTMAYVIPGRNAPTQWAVVNDGKRLSPTCAPCLTAVVCTPPLPVELASFQGECDDNKATLRWVTSSEVNNSYFTVERSFDAVSYEKLVNVEGAGNSNELLQYSFVDNEPRNGTSYYRLKQVDMDGNFKIYEPVVVGCELSGISVLPNPNNGTFKIMGIPTNSDVTITDIFGHAVYQKVKIGGSVDIDLSHIAKGVYFITLDNGKEKDVKKVVIE